MASAFMGIFSILSAICFIYYIIIVVYAGFGSSFAGFWLLAGAGFGLLSVLFYFDRKIHIISKIPKPVIISVCGIIGAGVILFVFLFGCVVRGMVSKPENKADYIIVLGAQIRGDRITKSLRKRLDAAIEYYNTDNTATIIVSGGQGEGENTSEAFAMKKYLMEHEIPEDSIIMEDKSSTTNENLKFSYKIICDAGDEDANILICSNNFHIFRAVRLAKHIGIKNVEGLAAQSDNKLIVNYMVRDSFAIFKEFLLGNISVTD
ncbi:MAG: YdcF family protein [Lachnospiraceae bacterium]